MLVDEIDSLIVGPNGLHEADGVRVDLLCLLGHVGDVVRDVEVKPDEVADLLEERDDLRVKVDRQLEGAGRARLDDVEQPTGDLHVSLLDVVQPGLVERAGVQLSLEARALALQLLALGVVLPALSENVLDPLHVGGQLPFDLTGPDDGTCHGGQVPELRHVVGLRVAVILDELLVKRLDVLLDRLDELRLILLDRSSDLCSKVRRSVIRQATIRLELVANLLSDEERVEPRKDAEHLVGVPGRTEAVAKSCDDLVLDSCNPLVVGGLCGEPDLRSTW